MPFTLSHAAAVIPFRRTPLVMSALVIGCFAPDFSYLHSLSPGPAYSHTIRGMFLLDLPLALAALWLFHTFLKQPMLVFLPDGFRQRLRTSVTDFPFWPSKRLWLILVSVLVGTATHLLWDGFTHQASWIYQHWSALQGSVELPAIGQMRVYKLLEYGSGVFGLLVVIVWVWHWYGTTEPSPNPVARPLDGAHRQAFVTAVLAAAIAFGTVRAYYAGGIRLGIRPMVYFTAHTLISAISFFLFALLVSGILGRILRRWPVFGWQR